MHCKQARQEIDRVPKPAQASPELTQHIAQCSPCAKFFAERAALRNALDNLRAATATLGPSTHVERQVLAALNATASNPYRTHPTWRWIAATSLTFAALVVAILSMVSRTHRTAPIAGIPHEEPFTAMPYVVPAGPYERTTIVRTRISSQIMQDAGLQVQDGADSSALADVVLGDGGRLLALRLVSYAHPVSGERTN